MHLAHLRNQHEAFARDGQGIRQLDVARENQYEIVARAELVIGRHGTREQRQELRRRPLEHIDAKDFARLRSRAAHQSRVVPQCRVRQRRKAECLQRRELLGSGNGDRFRSRGIQVGVEQRQRIAARAEPRTDLLSGEA